MLKMDAEFNASSVGNSKDSSQTNQDVSCSRNKHISPPFLQQTNTWKNHMTFKRRSSKKKAKAEALNLYNALDICDSDNIESNKTIDKSENSSPSDVNPSLPSLSSSDGLRELQASSCSTPLELISEYDSLTATNGNEISRSRREKSNLNRSLSTRGYSIPCSNSIGDSFYSTSSSSFSAHSPPPVSRQSSLNLFPTLSRSFSISPSHRFQDTRTPRRRKRLNIFGSKASDFFSSSMSSMQSPNRSDVAIPSPVRFAAIYYAVRKGVSEHISVNTAELNVLQVRKTEATRLNAAQSYDAEKLIKHLERVIKKLQYQQIKLDEVYEAYVLQQRYREGACKLKSALISTKTSSKSSFAGIKSDIERCTETLCALEQELSGLLGGFHVDMNGLLGFARLRAGDQYEIVVRYGQQKWRIKGSVKSSVNQTWDNTQRTLQPLLTDLINIKVMEVKVLGHLSTVGNVWCETKNLFQVEPQDLIVDLNDTATLKLSLRIKWSPYEGYEAPPSINSGRPSFPAHSVRPRTRSAIERPVSAHFNPRNRLSTECARPLSVIYSSSNVSNSSNNGLLQISRRVSTANNLTGRGSIDSSNESSNEKATNRSQKSNADSLSTHEEMTANSRNTV